VLSQAAAGRAARPTIAENLTHQWKGHRHDAYAKAPRGGRRPHRGGSRRAFPDPGDHRHAHRL